MLLVAVLHDDGIEEGELVARGPMVDFRLRDFRAISLVNFFFSGIVKNRVPSKPFNDSLGCLYEFFQGVP